MVTVPNLAMGEKIVAATELMLCSLFENLKGAVILALVNGVSLIH